MNGQKDLSYGGGRSRELGGIFVHTLVFCTTYRLHSTVQVRSANGLTCTHWGESRKLHLVVRSERLSKATHIYVLRTQSPPATHVYADLNDRFTETGTH